jgi:hypothetical protein
MFTRIFRQNQPIALLLLPVLAAILWPGARPHLAVPDASWPQGMPLYQLFLSLIGPSGWARAITGGLLAALLAVLLNVWANENDLFERRNHLPALLLIPLMALAPMGLALHPATVGMPFVLWALRRVWNRAGDQRLFGALFDAGCLIGIASLFHLSYAFTLVVLWTSLASMRPFKWREYVVPFLALVVVLFIAWGSVHLFAPRNWDLFRAMHTLPGAPALAYEQHWAFGVVLGTLAVAFGVATALSFLRGYGSGVLREKNTRSAFVAFSFTLGLLILFERLLGNPWPAAMIAVPLSVAFAWPILRARTIGWAETGIWVLLLLALWARWMG